ncbi:MAG TPA: anthranilate synthase component I, partial [Thermodesulfobacterium commune]|nr:anthranilate synthase component I [Thermodesulfobacterium commune]
MSLKVFPEKEVFIDLAKKHNLVPVYTEVACDLDTPISLFYKIGEGSYSFLLESLEGGEKWARYSFIGIDPYLVFKSKGNQINLLEKQGDRLVSKQEFFSDNPFYELRKFIKKIDCAVLDGLPRFFGGAVGFIGYEVVRLFEKIPVGEDVLGFSDLHFMFPEVVLIYDRFKHTLKIVYNANIDLNEDPSKIYQKAIHRLSEIKHRLSGFYSNGQSVEKVNVSSPQPEITKEEFCSMV